MAKKKKVYDSTRIIKRECDEPMAKKKGYLPCEGRCKECHACIETLGTGERRHVTFESRRENHER